MRDELRFMLEQLSDMSLYSDYHIHSSYSGDGVYTVSELFEQFELEGLKGVSIADHDCMDATKEAVLLARNKKMFYIPAVEVTTYYEDHFVHILGYGYNEDKDNPLRLLIGKINQKQIDNMEPVFAMIHKAGLYLNREQFDERRDGRAPMVSSYTRMILEDPRNKNHPIIQPYLPGGEKSLNGSLRFAIDYMLYGKPFYVPELQVSMEECVQAIADSGGAAVMAHPGVWMEKRHAALLPDLKKLGLFGMEVYTPYHSEAQRKFYEKMADSFGLYKTHGSDYHGYAIKPKNRLGQFTLTD